MLHLKFALNLEHLADEMIEAVSKEWKDPFNAPVVIFPDPKLEQWFRLRWMKKKGVLANLNKSTIDRFLFDILVGKDDSKKKLTAEMLTNVILAYLEKDNNYKTLCSEGDDEVTRYLEVDGKLDYNHLFDFASKMASLFLDYETSRPKGFVGGKDGFLDKWKQNVSEKDGLFFTETKESLELREKWQRKLYSAIFHRHGNEKSLLEHVFEEEAGRTGEKKEYNTIPYLFKACNEGDFNLDKLPKGGDGAPLPVFIFGLSGMGQFYRVILQKFAAQYDVYAYIQNPCMEFWEDTKLEKDSVCRRWNVSKGNWKSETGNIDQIQERMQVRDPAQLTAGKFETDIDDIPECADSLNQENDLLASWGRSGRDNIKLWCIASDYDFDFKGNVDESGQEAEIEQDTLLHKVQYSIAHRQKLSDVTEGDLSDKSLDVTAAPTKIREIENLHTRICELLNGGARVEDVLVVSPCLDEYRTAINMVFDQTPVKDSKNENGFLHVRFAIVDSPAKASLTENALSNLFSILAQKSITRPDFFALVRNPVVQTARGIRNEEIDAWQEWVAETNTYRTRDTKNDADELVKKDDWDKVVKRLLLAQMTTDDVSFGGNEYRPYADMACSDKASLCRFVECIESLERWIEFGCDESVKEGDFLKKIDREQLGELSALLDEWIGMQNTPKSLKSEDIVHKRVAEALEQLYCQFSANASKISMNIVKQSLLLAAQGTEYSCGNLFVNGVTFMKFVPNRTIPVKHLFFIGADATSFPGAKQRNTLDLRKSCYPWPGDDSPVAKNRYAFLCQLMSTSESLHLSYVNKDIKKDAELYPSSVVNDLRKFIEAGAEKDASGKSLKWKEETISLDENRDYSELWTQKSLRNKEAYSAMIGESPLNEVDGCSVKTEASSLKGKLPKPPERVSFSQLSKFLFDPFQFRVNQMLKSDDEENVEKELFEPISFDALDSSIVLKKMLVEALSKDEKESDVKSDLKKIGKMPDGNYEKKQWEFLENERKSLLEQIEKTPDLVNSIKENWSYGEKIQNLSFETDGVRWVLTGSLDWCNNKELKKVDEFIEITTSDSVRSERWLSAYVKSLALIALKDDEAEKTIKVDFYCSKAKKPKKATVSTTPENARKMLCDIYRMAFVGEKGKVFGKAVPYEMLNSFKEEIENPPRNSKGLIYEFRDQLIKGPWANFDKKDLFDPVQDVGFNPETFLEEWKQSVKKMADMVPNNKPRA